MDHHLNDLTMWVVRAHHVAHNHITTSDWHQNIYAKITPFTCQTRARKCIDNAFEVGFNVIRTRTWFSRSNDFECIVQRTFSPFISQCGRMIRDYIGVVRLHTRTCGKCIFNTWESDCLLLFQRVRLGVMWCAVVIAWFFPLLHPFPLVHLHYVVDVDRTVPFTRMHSTRRSANELLKSSVMSNNRQNSIVSAVVGSWLQILQSEKRKMKKSACRFVRIVSLVRCYVPKG